MAANNNNRRSARTGANQEAPVRPDQLRSLNDWKKLPLETLKLKCDANRLPNKGKKLDLSVRLFQHFHPDGVARVRERNRQKKRSKGDNAGSRMDVDDLPPAPPEIIRAEDEPNDVNDAVGTEDSNSTQAYDDDDAMGNAGTTTDVNDVNDGSIKLEETRRVSRVLAWR